MNLSLNQFCVAGLVVLLLLSGCYTATEREATELQALPEAFSMDVQSTAVATG